MSLSPTSAPENRANVALEASVARLCQGIGLTRTVARWLAHCGHHEVEATRRFLSPRLADLTSPDGMADRERVAERLARAVRASEHVVVFGDYDCDGITSAAIVTEVIRALGGRATPLIASRFEGGYGVSGPAVDKILALGPALLVTCDCGSSDHATLSRVCEAGVDVIVIDHHLVPDRPLPALGFLNPHRPECNFGYKGLASCGLALSVAAALRKALGATLDLRYWLDLVAIGTVADVAPLDGDNRALVRAGLGAMHASRRPGMRALLELAKLTADTPITGRDVAYRIAPQINAPGRLGSPELALKLLMAKGLDDARDLAAQLAQVSERRRTLSREMEADAVAEIERSGFAEEATIVIGREGWNPGIVGITAGRLSGRFGKPVIVVGFEGGVGRGSVRGPAGSRLHDALSECGAALEKFGGHQRAAGVELRFEQLSTLRGMFSRAVAGQDPVATAGEREGSLVLDPLDDPLAVLRDLDRLEPCGEANARPRLLVTGSVCDARAVKNGHLKLTVNLGRDRRLSCFAIDQGPRAQRLRGEVRLVGDLRHNTFPGAAPVEMFAEEIEEGPLASASRGVTGGTALSL